MDRVLAVDPDAATATVQPGVVQEALQRAADPHGLRFGPDPSSSSRCTIGGMIGNNACGTRALGYGRTSDNLLGVAAITGTGATWDAPAVQDGLRAVTRAGLATIRTEFGRFGRQVSGFALENLLPENGFGVHRLLAGSEGTLAVLTEATVRLVSEPAHRILVVLGYPDIAAAGDATPQVLTYGPVACEGIDSRIVEYDVPARTSAEAAAVLGCEVAQIAKSLVFRAASGTPVLVIASGVNRVDVAKVAQLAGEPIGKADATFVRTVTGYAIGGIPPLGHAQALRAFVDRDLLRYPVVYAAGGTPHAMFPLSPQELPRIAGAAVADVAEVPQP